MQKNHQHLLAFGMAMVLTAGLGGAACALAVTADQTGLGATGAAAGVTNSRSIIEIVGTLVNSALGLVGVVLLLLIIYAGFTWMTAQGDSKKVDAAKTTLTNAVIGMVIIFAAYSISSFVVGQVLTATTETSPTVVDDAAVSSYESCVAACAESDTECASACMTNN